MIPKFVAIAALDPGRITGVARGVFPIAGADTVAAAYAAGSHVESWECEGTVAEQVAELVEELTDWFADIHVFGGIPLPNLYVVREDFKLRQRSADLTPVEISAAFDTTWMSLSSTAPAVPIETQMPAQAKGFATDARLRRWGAWTVGSTHRRDATRHVLLKISRLMG